MTEIGETLRSVDVPRSAVHGDFWRGNVAGSDGDLRVHDWEWGRLEGLPTFDPWTYALADVRLERNGGSCRDGALSRQADRVVTCLAAAGLPPELATLTVAPTLAELALRAEERSGIATDLLGDRWLFELVSRYVIDMRWSSAGTAERCSV